MKLKVFVLGLLCTLMISLVFQMCIPKSDPEVISYSYKEKLITQEQENILDEVYTKFNYSYINEKRDPKLPDSREYWYSLETLESYIAFVKREAKAKGYENVGIKIKMGQYPEQGGFDPRVPAKYNGYQTIYFKPTGTEATPNKAQVKKDNKSETSSQDFLKGEDLDGIPGMDVSNLRPPY